jgi:hypothetical protein
MHLTCVAARLRLDTNSREEPERKARVWQAEMQAGTSRVAHKSHLTDLPFTSSNQMAPNGQTITHIPHPMHSGSFNSTWSDTQFFSSAPLMHASAHGASAHWRQMASQKRGTCPNTLTRLRRSWTFDGRSPSCFKHALTQSPHPLQASVSTVILCIISRQGLSVA